MFGSRFALSRLIAALAVMVLVGLASTGAFARPVEVAQKCHMSGNGAEAVLLEADWICDDSNWSIAGEDLYLRFRLGTSGQPPARSFVTIASRFRAIVLTVVDADGAKRSARFGPHNARHLPTGPMMVLPLPEVSRQSTYVMVRIERPWTKSAGSAARLDSDLQGSGWPITEIVSMAAICGLLVVPLLLTAAFYAVLPERFVLWHLVVTASMLFQVLIGTGFIHLLMPMPESIESQVSNLCFAVMGSGAMMFAATFIEPGQMSGSMRSALVRGAPLVFLAGAISALPFETIRPWAALLVHIDMLPPMFLVSVSALNARRHGSINAWYQIGGWTPTMVVGLVKILAYALPGNPPLDGTVIVQFCLAIQVLVATMGIISRFVVLRVERDRATARAEEMEGVAGRDALTGLWNRRSIEQRFDELFAKGFRTMAVLDLDHFKSVNDFHGHGVGDSVLKAAATALASDADTRGVRIGGEEFLLLLRGPDSAERAERCRRAISTRIAAGVPGLDRVVTASMGLIEHDAEWALDVDFDALYEQCDKMLYDAKRLGRNRTMSQKLTSFMPERRALPI